MNSFPICGGVSTHLTDSQKTNMMIPVMPKHNDEERTHMIAMQVVFLGGGAQGLAPSWAMGSQASAITPAVTIIVVIIKLQWPGLNCKGTQGRSRPAVRRLREDTGEAVDGKVD